MKITKYYNISTTFLEIAKVKHIHLALDVNFDKEILEGSVTLTVEKVDPNATHVLLDTNYLDIESILDESNNETLDFTLYPKDYVGSKLEVNLPDSKENEVKIKIDYKTSENCTALQWLTPEQTADKTHPYVFSQCQAIHCRSKIHLQLK